MENLSKGSEARHTRFHRDFAKNYTVDEITRRVVYDALGFDGSRTMSPETTENLLQVVTMSNWSRLYNPGTTISIVDPSAGAKIHDIRGITRRYLEDEQRLLDARLEVIHKRESPPMSPFLKAFIAFFHEQHSPLVALKGLYNETCRNHDLWWVKAMDQQSRHAILRYLTAADIVDVTSRTRGKLLNILHHQHKHIRDAVKAWS